MGSDMRWGEYDYSRELGIAEGKLRSVSAKVEEALTSELSRDELIEVLHTIAKTVKMNRDAYGHSR